MPIYEFRCKGCGQKFEQVFQHRCLRGDLPTVRVNGSVTPYLAVFLAEGE